MWWNSPPDKHRPPGWNLIKSFGCALAGIGICLARERNLRIDLCILGAVCWLAARLDVSRQEWALLLLAAGLVLTGEVLNSALETIVDAMTQEYQPFARRAKDMAAGAVLLAAFFAAGVGLAVLWRPAQLLALAQQVFSSPWRILGLGLALGFGAAVILLPFGPTDPKPRKKP